MKQKIKDILIRSPYNITNGFANFIKKQESDDAGQTFGTQFEYYYGGKFEKDKWYDKTEDDERNHFIEMLSCSEGDLILNAGFGNHTLLKSLNKLPAEFVGIDSNKVVGKVYRKLKNYKNITIMKADIFNMPFKDESFDKIWCSGVIHHTPDPEKALQKLVKVLKKNGRIYLMIYGKRPSPYLFFKKIFPNTYKWKDEIIFFISYYFAFVLSLPIIIWRLCFDFRWRTVTHTIRRIALGIYDSISCKYLFRYSEKEVRDMFERNGLEYEKVGFWQYVGRKVK